MTNVVDLGFVEKRDKWLLTNRFFPSKVGGKIAWLNLEDLPTKESLQCVVCSEPLVFLCQVYAPISDRPDCFHRTLFVFVCKTKSCWQPNDARCVVVFRSQLPLVNAYFATEPSSESVQLEEIVSPVKLCHLCGCRGPSMCSKCRKVNYCSVSHQKFDWPQHKKTCGSNFVVNLAQTFLFPEFELVLEEEIIENKGTETEEEFERKQFEEYEKLVKDGKTGSIPASELEKYTEDNEDKTLAKFKERIDLHPDQVLRYSRKSSPLWISKANKITLEEVPKCEICGGNRCFEFQIMPQLINFLENEDIDWGIIAVYTCEENCDATKNYVKEFVYKQDIMQ